MLFVKNLIGEKMNTINNTNFLSNQSSYIRIFFSMKFPIDNELTVLEKIDNTAKIAVTVCIY